MSQKFFILLFTIAAASGIGDETFNNVVFTKLGSDNSDERFEMTYYLPLHFASTWQNVRPICQSYDMEFLTLETEAEANNFLELCKSHEKLFDSYTHIGGITTEGKNKDKWFWVTTGEKINFPLRWANGEPNNYNGAEMCLSITKNSIIGEFFFNDIPCNGDVKKFVCQQKTYKKVP